MQCSNLPLGSTNINVNVNVNAVFKCKCKCVGKFWGLQICPSSIEFMSVANTSNEVK